MKKLLIPFLSIVFFASIINDAMKNHHNLLLERQIEIITAIFGVLIIVNIIVYKSLKELKK